MPEVDDADHSDDYTAQYPLSDSDLSMTTEVPGKQNVADTALEFVSSRATLSSRGSKELKSVSLSSRIEVMAKTSMGV